MYSYFMLTILIAQMKLNTPIAANQNQSVGGNDLCQKDKNHVAEDIKEKTYAITKR